MHFRSIDDGVQLSTPRRVLVVDDSAAQRRLLGVSLARWGYEVIEAENAEAALALCREQPFDIILSDWVMPGLSGLEFCQKYREMDHESYGYFILLTSKSEKEEVASGLEAGADDFLTKPVTPAELRARMRAGERLLSTQRELREKNRLLEDALNELQAVHDVLNRDLIEARKLQQALVRESHLELGSATITQILQPSGHVGGDIGGFFPLVPGRLGFFSVDVSGHGVASAMMAARLAGILSSSFAEGNATLGFDPAALRVLHPEEVAERLNHLVLEIMQVEQYFTCIYGDADLDTGLIRLVQAGHPHPLLLSSDGLVRQIGNGGLPIGLIPLGKWDRIELTLMPGDRLLMVTDGLTECRNPHGQELGSEGLAQIVRDNFALTGTAFLDALQRDVRGFSGCADLNDDVSAVLLEWRGSQQG